MSGLGHTAALLQFLKPRESALDYLTVLQCQGFVFSLTFLPRSQAKFLVLIRAIC